MNFESQPMPIDILLVEDNAGDVRLTQEVLKNSKVRNTLIVASNGQEALNCLAQAGEICGTSVRPDLILLDLNLPVMDGREVLDADQGRSRSQTHSRGHSYDFQGGGGYPENV